MLSLPPPPGLHAKSAQAARRLEQGDSAEPLDLDLANSMKLLLRPYLGNSTPSIELSAEIIGMSARTLQRRLGATGLTHSGLLEQVRFETAAQMLKNTEQNVIHVAYEVGYEDPSNFARAFRRIAGVSPREYRQRLTAD